MKPLILFALALALMSCNTRERVAARHDGQCRSYGFTPGTANYGKCRIILQTQHDQLEMRRAENMSTVGLELMRQSQRPAPTVRHTDCSRFGNAVSCTTR